MVDLELATLDQIAEELQKRFPAMLLVVLVPGRNVDETTFVIHGEVPNREGAEMMLEVAAEMLSRLE